MTEREKFEKWAQEEKLNIAKIEIGYLYSSTEDAWMGWQAARATPALPEGMAIVPVELLIRAVWMLRPGLALEEELRAIIEDKP